MHQRQQEAPRGGGGSTRALDNVLLPIPRLPAHHNEASPGLAFRKAVLQMLPPTQLSCLEAQPHTRKATTGLHLSFKGHGWSPAWSQRWMSVSTVLPVMSTGCFILKLPLKLPGRDLFQRMPNGLSHFLHLKTLLLQSLSSLTFHRHTNTTQAHPAQRPLGSNRT